MQLLEIDLNTQCNFSGIIGLTGGIGSGKSVIARILRCNGLTVYDCDSEAKKLMANDFEVKEKLIGCLGPEVFLNDGTLNKQWIAGKIFSDFSYRDEVNAIVHQAVREDIIKNARKNNKFPLFIESAILATARLVNFCQQIWVVTAPKELRIERVAGRDGLKREEILKRIDAQDKEFENLPHDKVLEIENDGNTPVLYKVLYNAGIIKE